MQFVDIGSRECYVGMLYACYDLIRPDVILEVSWRNGLHDFTMVSAIRLRECQGRANIWQPYMINFLAQQAATIELLKKDNEERKTREQSQQKNEENTPILGASASAPKIFVGSTFNDAAEISDDFRNWRRLNVFILLYAWVFPSLDA